MTIGFLLRRILVLLAIIGTAPFSWAETPIFEATYKGKYSGLGVTTVRRLVQLEDGTFELSSRASNLFGSLTETSHFRKDEDVWLPLTYTYRRKILGVSATETITYDWSAGTAQYTHSDKPRLNTEHRLKPGMLDPALYQLRMQRDLVLGQFPLDYTFVKRNRLRHYAIASSRGGDLTVGKRGQELRTIKLERSNSDDEKNTYVWAIPTLYYLFGKILHIDDDGDEHQMSLTGYRYNESALLEFFGKTQPEAGANTGD